MPRQSGPGLRRELGERAEHHVDQVLGGPGEGVGDRNADTAREGDAEDRLITRLETRLNDSEKRINDLEKKRALDSAYILELTSALMRAGINVPPRKEAT